jgi:hypothetical protein
MACTPQAALSGVSYDCASIIGGLKRVFVGYREGDGATINGLEDMISAGDIAIDQDLTSATFGQITVTAPVTVTDVFTEIEFNKKDGVSVFNDVVTVNADGSKEVVPTVLIEVPKMSVAHMGSMALLSQANVELVALVETAANTWHLVGADFGLYAGTVDGTSGTGRTEKNRYQLTLTGSEGELAYQFTSKDDFDAVTATS